MKFIATIALSFALFASSAHACDGFFGGGCGSRGGCGSGYRSGCGSSCGSGFFRGGSSCGPMGGGSCGPGGCRVYYHQSYYPVYPTAPVQVAPRTSPLPPASLTPQPELPVPQLEMPKKQTRINFGTEKVESVKWIWIRKQNGAVLHAPVVNGYMPQPQHDANGVVFHYDLRIPYSEAAQKQMEANGFVDYQPRTEALTTYYKQRTTTAGETTPPVVAQPAKQEPLTDPLLEAPARVIAAQ